MSESVERDDPSVEALAGRVADEFLAALDRGERPDIEEVVRRHPHYAAVLRDVLSALLAMRSASGPAGPADLLVLTDPTNPSGCLGDFRLLGEVGRGGMGVVYEAEQVSLGRRVALKVLPFAAALDAGQLRRFRNEAQAAAHLHHTNIVPVYAVGCERGVHYYAMQFIDGQNLASVIGALRAAPAAAPRAPAGRPTPPLAALTTDRQPADPEFFRAVARLGVQAAEALEHAHRLGIVHRDVKPANLIVDANGHLWVTDFGLARLQDDAGLTRTGDLLGTLAYMSPEQARGKPALVDHRTDVYSLGASLYEVLALAPPFQADGRAELLRAIAEDEPARPRPPGRVVPAELETIVLKALAKDPADRYATAQALADDLRRFVEDKPILARPPTTGQRLRRWARRHRAGVRAGLVVAAFAVVTVLVGLAVTNVVTTAERDRARAAEADRARQLYDALVAQARASRLAGRVGARAEALAALEAAARLAPGLGLGPERVLELRNEVIAAAAMVGVGVEREWPGRPSGTRAVAFDAELRRYARCEADGTVIVRRVADDGEEVRLERVAPRGHVFLKFGPGGRHLAVWALGGGADSAAVWDLAGRRPCLSLGAAIWVDFSPTDGLVATRELDGPLRVLEVETGRVVVEFNPGVPAVWYHTFHFDPRGRMLAVRSPDRTGVEVWHRYAPNRPHKLGTPGPVGAVAWHSDGKRLAIGSGLTVLDWYLGDAEARLALGGHLSGVAGLEFSPDRGLLASVSFDETLRLWDPRSGRLVLTAPGAMGPWFSRDGRFAFANGPRLVVARADPPEGMQTLYRGGVGISSVDVSPDSRLLAATESRGVFLCDLATGTEAAFLPIGRTADVAFDPAAAQLITGGESTPVARWPVVGGPGTTPVTRVGPPDVIRHPAGPPSHVSLSNDGRTVVVGFGREVHVLDWPGGVARTRQRAPENGCRPEVSPDGRWVAAGCWHGLEARVWDSRTGAEAHGLAFPIPSHCRVQFSPDRQWLVFGSAREYQGFETRTWRRAWVIPRENAGELPGVAAFSSDGLVAVAHSPTLVKLYRAGTADEVAALPAPDPHLICSLRFSPTSDRLVAGTEGDRLFVWDLRAVRAGLARLGLDWELPPYPTPVAPPSGQFVPARTELGELDPTRRGVADLRRLLGAKPDDPALCNSLARALVTGPDDIRDPLAALPLALNAVRLDPHHVHRTTLGVVYYRLGRLADAVGELDRAAEAHGGGGTAHAEFALAVCHHRLGDAVRAGEAYDRGIRGMELFRPDDEELTRLRAEAAALLGR
jgi:serine/threonine protein kinase/WD40 repeat protein